MLPYAAADPQQYRVATRLTTPDFLRILERRIVFGVTKYDPPEFESPKTLNTPFATIAAATNTVLLRRRNHNAHHTKSPLQFDTATAVKRVFDLVCTVATATRTAATREENRIYTHYEGWLPPDEDLPTTEWQNSWCGNGILRDTYPRASLALSPVTTGAPDPVVDTTQPDVAARLQQRAP